jgi:4'-phosphopantetheinyl transferase
MKVTDMLGVASIARTLGDDQVHVFHLPYAREQKRLPLLQILGAYLGVASHEVVLVDGEFGRPALSVIHATPLDFNWSHSGECALVAIGRQFTPGIDIERRRDRARALDIAEHYFCKDELAALNAIPVDARSSAFLELWTAKEAVLKALGRGLAFGLDRLHIVSDHDQPRLQWLDGDDALAWQVHRLDVGDGYLAAVAWRGPKRAICSWAVDKPA